MDIFKSGEALSADGEKSLPETLFLLFAGFLVGLFSGAIIAVFRISSSWTFGKALEISGQHRGNFFLVLCWLVLAAIAALVTGRLIKNPAIMYGGAGWEMEAIAKGQPKVWKTILAPKFIGSWLVMAFGVSVGREGPCIQMGAATALGLRIFNRNNAQERRLFVLGGCAAGLAAAFSAPFAGICYVYEVMREKISRVLLAFMLAGSYGVYLSCTLVFDLGVMIPFGGIEGFSLLQSLWLAPLGVFCGLCGAAYNWLIRRSKRLYSSQKFVPLKYRTLFSFLGAALMLFIYPEACGEGLNAFTQIEEGRALLSALWLFLLIKLIFTAFCYGSGIPAGLMVPLLCVGGVSGGIFACSLEAAGFLAPGFIQSCMVMGMIASFAAGEIAPITAIMLVLEMTGAWTLAAPALIAAVCARLTAKALRLRPM